MGEMGRCATCRHWDTEPHTESPHVRRCLRVLEWWEATEWSGGGDEPSRRDFRPEARDVLAFVNDASSWQADLLTRAEFGCVMHEKASHA